MGWHPLRSHLLLFRSSQCEREPCDLMKGRKLSAGCLHLCQHPDGQEAVDPVHSVERAVVHEPPADGPGHAQRVIREQADAELLRVLQEEGRQQPPAEGCQEARLSRANSRISRFSRSTTLHAEMLKRAPLQHRLGLE